MIDTPLSLDLSAQADILSAIVQQGDDNSRQLRFALTRMGERVLIPEGTTARCFFKKPDEKFVIKDCEILNNEIVLTFDIQMTVAAGIGIGKLFFTNLTNAEQLSSVNFKVKIASNILSNGEVLSVNELESVTKQLLILESYSGQLENINQLFENDTALSQEITTLSDRLTAIASLEIEEGSLPTSGELELVDTRIGFDGTSYTSAGAAMRGQAQGLDLRITDCAGKLSELKTNMGAVTYNAAEETLSFTRNVAYDVVNNKVVLMENQSNSWYAADPIDVEDYTSIRVHWYMSKVVTFPYLIIADGNDNVLYSEYGSEESAIFDSIIEIPYGATKIYFNHRLSVVSSSRPGQCFLGKFRYYEYMIKESSMFIDMETLKETLSISNDVVTIDDERELIFNFDATKIQGNIIVECEAQTNKDATIQFAIDNIYKSPKYNIGNSYYMNKKWRVPRPPVGASTVKVSIINPDDNVLNIRFLESKIDNSKITSNCGLKLDAHLGFGLYPQNTMLGYIGAVNAGFNACIASFRQTSDGVYVCIHDDSINATARDANGDRPSETINVSESTYAQLLEWDFGRYKSDIYIGEKIPTAEQFFDLCSKTGTKPIISSKISSVEIWNDIKDMVIKYGLLAKLHIKAFSLAILETAYSVFGDTIDGYTLDRASNTIGDYANNITSLQNLFGTTPSVRIGIEYLYSELSNSIAPVACRAIVDAGMFVSTYSTGILTGSQYKELQDLYITEITADYNTSCGLNW